MEDFKRHIEVV